MQASKGEIIYELTQERSLRVSTVPPFLLNLYYVLGIQSTLVISNSLSRITADLEVKFWSLFAKTGHVVFSKRRVKQAKGPLTAAM